MKKVDIPCFLLSLGLSFFVLFLLSMTLPKPSEEVETLKIGLIASENNNVFESDGSSSSDATPANVEKPKLPEPPKLEEIEEETEAETKTEEKVEERGEIKKPNLADLKKMISKPKLENPSVNMERFDKKTSLKNGIGIDIDKILSKASGQKGLPSGSRMGVIDGTAVIQWNPGNPEPDFPEIAKKTGKNGSVILLITVNEAGEVISVRMEQGSGVPEINEAISKVARTWKVKLVKKGRSVGGTFVLKYSFHLK
ncbi:TonB family protein [Fusobacterium necrophorum]|uniref:energy transducer TonB n=1 Tax=Fusobacterium necrophorum TaxID=859 RepID=UPI00254C7DCE|nr:energy transducer TonB [Fusobacterium necrophorum]MDK4501456.1 TonB family protein [Fusobacterium necrophorum]